MKGGTAAVELARVTAAEHSPDRHPTVTARIHQLSGAGPAFVVTATKEVDPNDQRGEDTCCRRDRGADHRCDLDWHDTRFSPARMGAVGGRPRGAAGRRSIRRHAPPAARRQEVHTATYS